MADLSRSENLLSLLEEHLRPTPEAEASPLLESVVVNYMLTVIYADLEIAIHAVLSDFASDGVASRMGSFAAAAVKRVVRSIKCSELAGVLGMFDDDCKRHFQALVNDTPDQAAYDRIVGGRHDQAHSLGSDLTLDDVKADLARCNAVLAAFGEALACTCSHE